MYQYEKSIIISSATNLLMLFAYLQYKPFFALSHFIHFFCTPLYSCFMITDIGAHKFRLFAPFVMNIEIVLSGSDCTLCLCSSCNMMICTVVLIKILPYSGATAQTRSVALWGVSGSYGQAPAQQGMSGLVRETSHLWLYSSPSPSLQPILREPATSILIVLYTFECIMRVATESL